MSDIKKSGKQQQPANQVEQIVRQTLQTKTKLLSDVANPILKGFEEPCAWCKFWGNQDGYDVFIILAEKLNMDFSDNDFDRIEKEINKIIPDIKDDRICWECKDKLLDALD